MEDDTFQLVHPVEDQAPDDTYSDMHSVHQSQAPADDIQKRKENETLEISRKKSISTK